MSADVILDNIEELSDTEIAVLLCLIAREHCVIEGNESLLDDLAQEVGLVRNLYSVTLLFLLMVSDRNEGLWPVSCSG